MLSSSYDIIVIGSGLAGCAITSRLVKSNKSILLVEKGNSYLNSKNDIVKGVRAEDLVISGMQEGLAKQKTLRFLDPVKYKDRDLKPFLGSGTGGSSALYGAGLERIWNIDLSPQKKFPFATGHTLPEAWPVSLEEFEPYYSEAEKLMHVCGEKDPLSPPSNFKEKPSYPLSRKGDFMKDFLLNKGLHPYRTHLGISKPESCKHCVGVVCPEKCKMDGASTFLEPLTSNENLTILSGARVIKINMQRNSASSVEVEKDGRVETISSDIIVVSAGALVSPALLLGSRNQYWPSGIGNNHNQVGRNLMRHLVDFYFLRLPVNCSANNALSDFTVSDFYLSPEGAPFGSLKSAIGLLPYYLVEYEVKNILKGYSNLLMKATFPLVKSILDRYLRPKIDGSYIWSPILEDLPYKNNKVYLDSTGEMAIRYQLGSFEKNQIKKSRTMLLKLFKECKPFLLKQAENPKFLAHACGTCRFGDDPKRSVLDRNNKVHGTDNLFVVDASFFPSSTGCNPSLTIVANSLRVGDFITNGMRD